MITVEQLRSSGAFEAFSNEELAVLLVAGTVRTFERAEDLCCQGAVATECFIVLEGRVDVLKSTVHGERSMTSVGAGTIVGHMALIGNARHTTTLRMRDAGAVLIVEREMFQRMLDASSPMALAFQRQIAVSQIRMLRTATDRLNEVIETGTLPLVEGPSAPSSSPSPPSVPAPDSTPPAKPMDVDAYIESTAARLHVSVDALDAVRFDRHPDTSHRARKG